MSASALLKGTVILAGAALAARLIGVIQRIPLQRLLEDAGMATYTSAYNVYFFLLVLATAGFPSALAKLVAEKYALGRRDEGEAIHRTAVRYSLLAGVLAAGLVFWLAPAVSYINKDPNAALAIRALSPALLLFPWIAVERGFFHGRQRMGANGLSQIAEQVLRVTAAIALAWACLRLGYGTAWAAAGASFGGVLGAVGAAAVMLYSGRKLRRSDRVQFGAEAPGGRAKTAVAGTFAAILKLSVPVSVTALAVPAVYLIDTLIATPLLEGRMGLAAALETYGVLGGRAQPLAGIPVIFAIALSQSILPIISAAHAKGDAAEVERQASLALRVALLSGAPVVAVLAAVAFPLNTFIFGNANGSWIIAGMLAAVLFQIVMMTSASILLGLGKPGVPMKHIAVGVAVKFVLSFALAPLLGIYGVVAATAACFAATAALNLRSLRRDVAFTAMGRRSIPFAAAVALQSGATAFAAWALYRFAHPFGIAWLDALLQTAVASAVGAALYPVLLFRLKALTADDMEAMPRPVRKLWSRAEPKLKKLRMIR